MEASVLDTEQASDYLIYRGRCKELAEAAVTADSSLILVRGYYYCPLWGKQGHWWAKKPDGTIVDPSVKQFPSSGAGEYEEFDGYFNCSECGGRIHENDAHIDGMHVFCSIECHGRCVGLIES